MIKLIKIYLIIYLLLILKKHFKLLKNITVLRKWKVIK